MALITVLVLYFIRDRIKLAQLVLHAVGTVAGRHKAIYSVVLLGGYPYIYH
jgi:hypothetical protein